MNTLIDEVRTAITGALDSLSSETSSKMAMFALLSLTDELHGIRKELRLANMIAADRLELGRLSGATEKLLERDL